MGISVGLIYIIRAADRVKIGWCAGNVQNRKAELQIGCPDPYEVLVTFPGTRADEATLHRRFAALHFRGEWFSYAPALVAFVAEKLKPMTDDELAAVEDGTESGAN